MTPDKTSSGPVVAPNPPVLEHLVSFLAHFAPPIASRHEMAACDSVDDDLAFLVRSCRDDAVVAAFQAVERIAQGVAR